MPLFNLGEVVKCRLWIKDASDNLVDPTSIPLITIINPEGTEIVTEANETFEAVGTYFYPLVTTDSFVKGRYQIKHKVTDGVAVTIEWDEFELGH